MRTQVFRPASEGKVEIKIKARLEDAGANFQWFEVNGAHAFLRDEGYRYDPGTGTALLRPGIGLVPPKAEIALNGVSAILASTPDVYWLALPRS